MSNKEEHMYMSFKKRLDHYMLPLSALHLQAINCISIPDNIEASCNDSVHY